MLLQYVTVLQGTLAPALLIMALNVMQIGRAHV